MPASSSPVELAKPAARPPLIRMRGVKKIYRTRGEEVLAVQDVTLDVEEGELVTLVGPSGCGKSTVLKILAGLHPHDEGEVQIGGPDHPFQGGRDVGMVFQQPLLLKWRRILDNVLLPAEILGLPRKAARERMNLELLRIWADSHKTILFVTHGIQEAVFLATRVAVLTSGPARMADTFTVDLPMPRNLDLHNDPKFGAYTHRIYRLLGLSTDGSANIKRD